MAAVFRRCHNVIELFIRNIGPSSQCTVDNSLHLGIDRIKINRTCHNNHIRLLHLVQNLLHIVMYRTLTAVAAAVITGITGCYLFTAKEDFLCLIAALSGPS